MSQAPKQQLVKYQQGKLKFEILTKPGMALKYREGKIGWNKVMTIDKIFTNSTRGDIAKSNDLQKVFNTDDLTNCLQKIVLEGELQYSQKERKEMMDNKKKEIIYYIHKNYVNPKTSLPHPYDRIENCMKQCKINIDLKKDSSKQGDDAVKKMSGKLMFAKAVALTGDLTIKFAYDGKCSNLIKKYSNVISQKWNEIGCIYTIQLTKSGLDELTSKLNKATNGGDFTFVVEGNNENTSDNNTKNNKKKSKNKNKKSKNKKSKSKNKQSKN